MDPRRVRFHNIAKQSQEARGVILAEQSQTVQFLQTIFSTLDRVSCRCRVRLSVSLAESQSQGHGNAEPMSSAAGAEMRASRSTPAATAAVRQQCVAVFWVIAENLILMTTTTITVTAGARNFGG